MELTKEQALDDSNQAVIKAIHSKHFSIKSRIASTEGKHGPEPKSAAEVREPGHDRTITN